MCYELSKKQRKQSRDKIVRFLRFLGLYKYTDDEVKNNFEIMCRGNYKIRFDINDIKYIISTMELGSSDLYNGILGACESSYENLGIVKLMVEHLKDEKFENELNFDFEDLFKNACLHGHLNIIKFLLNNDVFTRREVCSSLQQIDIEINFYLEISLRFPWRKNCNCKWVTYLKKIKFVLCSYLVLIDLNYFVDHVQRSLEKSVLLKLKLPRDCLLIANEYL